VIGDVWPVVDAATMRTLDAHTISDLGVPGELLMESAGRAVAEAVLALRPSTASVLVVCGGGNNGGDGLVAARHLHGLGVPVSVALLATPRGDAAANLERARSAGVPVARERFRVPPDALVVDAVFGTGLSRPVSGPAAAALERLRGARVVAVDLPSGIDSDTGQILGQAVQAEVTVTLAQPKLGLTQEPGRSLAGRIVVARIGVADRAPGQGPCAELWTRRAAGRHLPERSVAGHKGSFGHVLVVAGSLGKTGAAALAAQGAGRSGAGLVSLACPAGLNPILEEKCTEAMTIPVPDTEEQDFAAGSEELLLALARERDVLALGPGIGRSDDVRALVLGLVERVARPLVVDADGLFAFGQEPGALKGRPAATIVTPHPGEAARLLGVSSEEINRDRPGSARRLAERSGSVVVLKGAGTVVAAPDGRMRINPTGGPALGSGGSGDVLTGVVAGFLGQGLDAFDAAALGAFVHGHAADRIAARTGPAGLLAGDLLQELPEAMQELRAWARSGEASDALVLPFPEPR
jgi:NAD(P)H-hydrate epimerase